MILSLFSHQDFQTPERQPAGRRAFQYDCAIAQLIGCIIAQIRILRNLFIAFWGDFFRIGVVPSGLPPGEEAPDEFNKSNKKNDMRLTLAYLQ
jgi:hypothetical protein